MKYVNLRSEDIKIKTGILMSCIAGIFSYLFFSTFANILTTNKIFNANSVSIIIYIVIPITLFAFCLYLLTFALLCVKTYYPVVLIATGYLFTQRLSLLSIGSTFCVLISFLIFARFFLNNLSAFKKPSISRSMKSALGLPFLILSLVIAINLYPQYSAEITKDDSILSGKVFAKLKNIITVGPNNFEGQESANITLEEYAKTLLQNQKITFNDTNLKLQEKKILTFYDVSALEKEKMTTIYTKALNKQVISLFREYRTQILLIIPLVFFLINQTFTSTSSYLAYFMIMITDHLLRMRKINLYKIFLIE